MNLILEDIRFSLRRLHVVAPSAALSAVLFIACPNLASRTDVQPTEALRAE